MSTHDVNGQIILTVVNGSTYTGRYAPDGSLNVVTNNGSTYTGMYHPCGAFNAVINETTNPAHSSNGGLYIRTKKSAVGYTYGNAGK